ncbi:MAG: sulfotransferase [Gaiellaceae bacterium]
MAALARSAVLHLKSARRLARPRPLRQALGGEDRLVFVLGSPRSGTTFLADAIGSAPGFVDLGEVAALKAAIPALAALPPCAAAERLRRLLGVTRAVGLVRGLRGVEQTPETAFLTQALARAFPQARLVHALRDGRDVACSLLERGWLGGARGAVDDAGLAYGAHARFWVEPERREEFQTASEARRAGWVWRAYVSAVRRSGVPVHEVRYEVMTADPPAMAAELAEFLGAPEAPLARVLGEAHAGSIGRYRRDLTPAQLADVEDEAGPLLRELGYA